MFWTHRSFWVLPILVAAILCGLSAIVVAYPLAEASTSADSRNRGRERLFLASLGFFITVLVVRALTLAIRYDIGPFHDVSMNGRHIHHLVWGILILWWSAMHGWSK